MVRRTISLPESIDKLIRRHAMPGESFSAAVARLVRAGAAKKDGRPVPSWIGSGVGPADLGENSEKYLFELLREH